MGGGGGGRLREERQIRDRRSARMLRGGVTKVTRKRTEGDIQAEIFLKQTYFPTILDEELPRGEGKEEQEKSESGDLENAGSLCLPRGPALPPPLFPGNVLSVAHGRRASGRCHLGVTRGRGGPEVVPSRDP